ncbi:GmrSD restriction endonuclease domain-containing protein [Plantactinospora sp. DSM 117369]
MAVRAEEFNIRVEVLLLEQLLDEVRSGRLRVPRFQRPYVWHPHQMLDLYDSIERGYPIGSILVWETSRSLPTLDRVAGIEVPPAPDGPVAYLLDGHQRLSTLFGTLVHRPEPAGTGRDRQWWIYRTLGAADQHDLLFQHWGKHAPPANLLPMQAVLRTMDFLAHARRLARDPTTADNSEALVDEAEQVAQRIKAYKIPVIRLFGGDLEHAVEAFSRVNSSGRQISPDQMVSALTYQAEQGETLTDRIASIRESIADSGFGDVAAEPVFQTIVAITGEDDVQGARWTALADRVGKTLDGVVAQAEVALHRAVRFLRYEAGVPAAWLVPYPQQVMLLALFFHHRPDPDGTQSRALVRWFWSTSWSTLFVGGNAFQLRRALHQMRAFATGRAELSLQGLYAQPLPERFDTEDGRVRAFLLWELNHFGQRHGLDGEPIELVDLLARSGAAAYRRIVTGVRDASSIANRIVLPTPPGTSVRDALLALPPARLRTVAVSHGVPPAALAQLLADDRDGFIRERTTTLVGLEQEFIQEIGGEELTWDTVQEDGS